MEHGHLIHLDNNFLTNLPERMSIAYRHVNRWLSGVHRIATSAIAWSEFLRGQSNNQRDPAETKYVKQLVRGEIAPFGEREAEMAAYMFNLVGRPKGQNLKLRMDCMIAACAVENCALLATEDYDDMKRFQQFGLELAELSQM